MTANCISCGLDIDESLDLPGERAPCPSCGSTVRVASVDAVDGVHARDGYALTAKRAGGRKPYVEDLDMPRHSVALDKLVHVQQFIDRDNDRYVKRVTDYETGKVLKDQEQRLSEHIGHGSAKPGWTPPPKR